MTKTEATSLLGGSINDAAEAIGITFQAYSQWPEVLTDKLRDRVQAALWRKSQGMTGKPMPEDAAKDETAMAAR